MNSFSRTQLRISLSFICLVFPSVVSASFTRTLSIGDVGQDVRELQIILNSRAETKVATTGPGSPGFETDYFGERTAAAVSRYQELFAADILTPLGLTAGTGRAGIKTLTHVNGGTAPTLSTASVVSGQATVVRNASASKFDTGSPTTSSGTSDVIGDVRITSVSPTHGPAGTRVTLRGVGFTENDNILFAGATQEEVSSSDGTTITFTVQEPFPDNIEVPDFLRDKWQSLTYGFVVQNENGKSNQVVFTLELTN